MEGSKRDYRAHVLTFPFPAQGHITPQLQFSKRLVSKGLKVTLITTIYTSKSMHLNPNFSITIDTVSDGFDEGGFAQAETVDAYEASFIDIGSKTLGELIKKYNDIGHPVDAIIYDANIPWVLDVAKQYGLLGGPFFSQSCAVDSIYYHVQRGLLELPLSGTTISIPGLPLLEPPEMPSFVYNVTSYPIFLESGLNQFSNIDQADYVIVNTFDKLEEGVVNWMSKLWPLITIGPTTPSMYLDKRIDDDKDYGLNLFKPNSSTCMEWLNEKPSHSVVYVSFGSVADMNKEQMEELAWGLMGSGYYFLWVVRESENAKLPELLEMEEKGLVVSWSPQLEVLAHASVGCFVTHCGFNSVLEALSLGVPMVAMPQWTDQPTNAKYVEDVWRTGVRALADENGIVRREVITLRLKEVMEGEIGSEIRKNTVKWVNLATEAVDEGGSSDQNVNDFVSKIVWKKS